MDNVFAKIKKLRKKPYFKILSDHTLFEAITVDVGFCPLYSPDHNLDEDAWFKIEEFSKKDFCIDIIKKNFDSKDYEDLKKSQFSDISYILSVQGEDFYFQKVTPSLYINKKTIAFGDSVIVEENKNSLLVNTFPDAVYLKTLDILIFRNLSTISSIFKGIDQLFKEATNEEVGKFLAESFISLAGEYEASSVSKPNRKRIALALDTLTKMSAQDRTDMMAYINDYCQHTLKFDAASNKFEISKDDELKFLLYGVEQRFYTTRFGNEKRLANSIQPIA